MRPALLSLLLATPLLAQNQPDLLWSVPIGSNSFGAASVADVDGDGVLDVAFASYFYDGRVRVLRGKDGKELWSWQSRPDRPQHDCLDASLRFADVDGDGRLELVVPNSSGSCVHAFDAKTGKKRWTYACDRGDCIDSPPAIVNLDDDPWPEVVFGSFRDHVHVVDGKSGERQRILSGFGGFVQTGVLVVDLNGDDVPDYVAGSFKGKNGNFLTAMCGKTEKPLWRYEIGAKPSGQASIGMYHGVSFGDLDGDGTKEIVFSAYDGRVVALDARTGKVRWRVAPGDLYFMSTVAIADVDADGKNEVIACSQRLTVIEGDGKVRYSVPLAKRGRWDGATRGASVADLDGDGKLDAAYLLTSGDFAVRRGFDGKLLYRMPKAEVFEGPVASNSHGPVLADFTGDGRLDAFYVVGRGSSREAGGGVAVCVTGFAGKGQGWPMLRHDLRNSGNVSSDPRSTELLRLTKKKQAARRARF